LRGYTLARLSRTHYAHQLHQRLLQDDPLAPAELAEEFLEELVRRLRARVTWILDDALLLDAAADALLSYAQQPDKFDPTKSGLMTYLTMSAYGDLLNMLSRESRRRQREVSFEDVEHRLPSRNNIVEDVEEEAFQRHGILTLEEKSALLGRIAKEFPDPRDRQILSLMLAGERRTTVYSQVLGVQALGQKEQQRIVKRHKDRINKRLQRLGGKLSGQK
jgi:RNA polymerase sigma-70 factor (ECF subfamily)